ncbi:MAG TPA: HAMP domain-containing sensor histidine kinase [Gemmataceae bacterium]|jgi:signal transduction histidine kinase|nr:HAMP domain-containing sensor histidine kinase [Gemmataceae bacterium]
MHQGKTIVPGTISKPEVTSAPNLAQSLGRSLRHELGDFLQKVYASVAILEARLPANWRIERDVLSRLRQRAEVCRDFLDAIQDYLCPVTLNLHIMDLAEVANQVTEKARKRIPGIQINTKFTQPVWLTADQERVSQIGDALVTNACEAARSEVSIALRPDEGAGIIEWEILDDGPGLPDEATSLLFRPFSSTRPGHVGLGLVLAQKLVMMHGGRLRLENRPEGGCSAVVSLPVNGVPPATCSADAETAT